MNARDKILKSIRNSQLPHVELPALDDDWTTYADPKAKFAEVIISVGGKCISVGPRSDLANFIKTGKQFANCKSVLSEIEGIDSTVQLNEIDRSHDLNALDLAVLPGEFGVAENGAVWITNKSLKHQAVLFIVEHLVLVVPGSHVVNNMHEAYERLQLGNKQFGCFISGPSKTADIEQALVIGAQGPRAHTVFLIDLE